MSEHREPRLLGNGKLTVAARLSSLAGAAVFGAVVAAAPFALPKIWEVVEEMRDGIKTMVLHVELQKVKDAERDRRITSLEDRATRLENRLLR